METSFLQKYNDYLYYADCGVVKVFLLLGNNKGLLIDTAFGFDGKLKEELEKTTDLPYLVINTHSHRDHFGGNDQFDQIYITKADAAYLPDHDYKISYVEDNDEFDLGGLTVRVIKTPGHTEGSICLYVEETGELFVGDTVNSVPSYMFADTYSVVIKSLKQIKSIQPKIIYGSHGNNPVPEENIDIMIDLAEKRIKDDFVFSVRYPNPDYFSGSVVYQIYQDGIGYHELHDPKSYRLFVFDVEEISCEISEAIEYVKKHIGHIVCLVDEFRNQELIEIKEKYHITKDKIIAYTDRNDVDYLFEECGLRIVADKCQEELKAKANIVCKEKELKETIERLLI